MLKIERDGQIGREIVVDGIRLRLRPGLRIVGGVDVSGEVKLGPGVRVDKKGTVIQDGQWWRSWAVPPIQYSSEATTNDPVVRGIARDFSPLYEIRLFSSSSRRFG